jgi:hypothetical protein
MNITPKTHAQQVRRAAERKAEFTPYITRIAYTTETGEERVQERLVTAPPTRRVCENTLALALGDLPSVSRECPEIAAGREHGIYDSVADLPGDRSIGYCVCGEYVDTGTADDRF